MKIFHEVSGTAPIALLFIHGWMGSHEWWKFQKNSMWLNNTVATMDLPGHGQTFGFHEFSPKVYADAIKHVADLLGEKAIVLVGHSMGGAYALEASLHIKNVKAVILVDTVKDLDQLMTPEIAEQAMFAKFRKDPKNYVMKDIHPYLFAEKSPQDVINKVKTAIMSAQPEKSIALLKPLFEMDLQDIARKVTVPVRAINSDFIPTNVEANQKYFLNYKMYPMEGTGHYPMMEDPIKFGELFRIALKDIYGN